MLMGNRDGQKTANDRQPETHLPEDEGTGNLGFVWVVCSSSVASAGLIDALEKAGVRQGPEPPPGSAPDCVVLGVQDAEHLTEAMGRIRGASAEEARAKCPILVFAPQNDPKLAEASLRGGARGFIHAGMRPEQILRALSVAAKGRSSPPGGFSRSC